jgi:hypothetical protein
MGAAVVTEAHARLRWGRGGGDRPRFDYDDISVKHGLSFQHSPSVRLKERWNGYCHNLACFCICRALAYKFITPIIFFHAVHLAIFANDYIIRHIQILTSNHL